MIKKLQCVSCINPLLWLAEVKARGHWEECCLIDLHAQVRKSNLDSDGFYFSLISDPKAQL